MAWYPFFPADYLGDTTDLSCSEHGVYHLLLHRYWLAGALPDDLDRLCRVAAGAPPETVRQVLEKYWSRKADGWHNPKLSDIRKKQESAHKRRVNAGRQGAEKKRLSSNATAMLPQCLSNQNQNQISTNVLSKDLSVDKSSATAAKTAATRTQCPYEKIRSLWIEILPELSEPAPVREWTAHRRKSVRDRWRDQLPDMEVWERLFRYIRLSQFLMGQVNGSRRAFDCTFWWVIKPENLLKIREKNYHRGST